MPIQKLATKFTTGAWLPNVKEYFKKVNEIIDYLNGTGTAGSGSYTEFRALLTQTSTNAPIAVDINGNAGAEFVNTIGGVWSYNNVGSFYFTKANAFSNISKIEVVIGANQGNQLPPVGIFVQRIDSNTLELQSGELSGYSMGLVTYTQGNDMMAKQAIVIRVYN